MIYTFVRIGAVLQMNVGDYFTQGRRGWVRLHEIGGKEHEAPCHHKLEAFLDEYIAAACIAGDETGPLFRTTGRAEVRKTVPPGSQQIRNLPAAGNRQNLRPPNISPELILIFVFTHAHRKTHTDLRNGWSHRCRLMRLPVLTKPSSRRTGRSPQHASAADLFTIAVIIFVVVAVFLFVLAAIGVR